MERLTKRIDGEAVCRECTWTCGTCDGTTCFDIGPMVDRIAAYEDTGMDPDEIIAMRIFMMGRTGALFAPKYFNGVSLDRMLELIEAEKDGRLVVLQEAALKMREDAD